MKQLFALLLALVAITAAAQTPGYRLKFYPLGTNTVQATSELAWPALVSSNVVQVPGATALNYTSQVTVWRTNFFASPSAHYSSNSITYTYTNSVVGSNTVVTVVEESFTNGTLIYPVSVAFTNTGTNWMYQTNAVIAQAPVFDISGQKDAAMQIGFALTNTGTANIVARMALGIDGANFPITFNWTNAATGLTQLYSIAQSNFDQLAWMKLVAVSNANSVPLTNLSFGVGQKAFTP